MERIFGDFEFGAWEESFWYFWGTWALGASERRRPEEAQCLANPWSCRAFSLGFRVFWFRVFWFRV